MKINNFLLLCIVLFSSTIFAHNNDGHPQENDDPITSMIPLPVSVDFGGEVSWGYHIDFSGENHTSHMGMDHSGMDHSGMDHSGMDMDSDSDSGMDMDSDSSMEMSDSSSSWHNMIMPMITLGVNNYTRLLNRSTSSSLNISKHNDGYIAIENSSIVLGGGLGLMAMPPVDLPMFSFRLSLMPYKGGHVFRLKQINDEKELEHLGNMVIPHDLNDLDTWKVGDRMAYSSKGGIMFGAGAGFSVLASVLTTYMSEGTWSVSVYKIGESSIYLSVQKRKMTMLGVKALNAITELSSSTMKHVDANFNFILDLKTDAGIKAYHDILQGNILAAQKASLEGLEGVELISRVKTRSGGRISRRSIGLPYLFNIRSQRSSMLSVSQLFHGFSGEEYQSHMSMYRKSVETDGRWSQHKNSGILFMGMTNENLSHPKEEAGFGANFKWYFQKDNTSRAQLKWQLNRLIHKFGFDKAKDLVIPAGNLGFVRAELDLSLGHSELKRLIEKTEVNTLYDETYTQAFESMNTYFSDSKNVRIHCGNNRAGICMRSLYKATWSALSKFPNILQKLKMAYIHKDYKLLNAALGNLGKISLTNRFVLREIFKKAGKKNINGVLKVQGSKLSQANIAL